MQNGLIERSFVKHVTKYVREWPDGGMGARQGFLQFSAQTPGMPAKTSHEEQNDTKAPQKLTLDKILNESKFGCLRNAGGGCWPDRICKEGCVRAC